MRPIIFTACDIDYFIEHGYAFVKSCVTHKMMTHVVISPNFTEVYNSQILRLNSYLRKFYAGFTEEEKRYIIEPKFLNYFYDIQYDSPKTYYSTLRFLECGKIISQNLVPLLILDVDSIVNGPIDIDPNIDLGLFLREKNITGGNSYEIEGMKVAAGAVYLTPAAEGFINDVREYLFENSLIWFCDQHALYSAYKKNKDTLNFLDFSEQKLIDWKFQEDSLIWTGKGNRKHNNKTYLERKKIYDGKFGKEFHEYGNPII